MKQVKAFGPLSSRVLRTIVILLTAAVVLVNVLLFTASDTTVMKDLTADRIYTASAELKSFLDGVREPITLHLIDGGGNDQKFEYYIDRVSEYSDQITLKKETPTEAAALLQQWNLSADNVSSLGYCLIAESAKRSEIVDYTALFYYEVKNTTLNSMGLTTVSLLEYSYYANYFSQNEQYAQYYSYLVGESILRFQGDRVLAAMLEYVTADIIPVHYVLTGQGEASLTDTALSEIYSYSGSTYQLLDLSVQASIPEDAATVLIVTPTKDYSAEQVQAMKQYLSRGGQLTVLTNEANLSMPNLMSLMATYGMTAQSGAVKEMISSKETAEEQSETTEQATPSDSVSVTINTAHDALAGLDQLSGVTAPVITGGNALELHKDALPSLLLHPLLITSEHAFIGDRTEEQEARTLAAAAETADGAHLIWFTGAYSFLASASAITESTDPRLSNAYCVYTTLSWANLTYESSLPDIEATEYAGAYLQATNTDAVTFLVWTVLLIPAAILLIGWGILHSRKKRSA